MSEPKRSLKITLRHAKMPPKRTLGEIKVGQSSYPRCTIFANESEKIADEGTKALL
jgi:hypothetical protein